MGGLVWFAVNGPLTGTVSTADVAYQLEGATRAEITLKPAVGDLSVQAGALDKVLLQGKISTAQAENFSETYQVDAQTARLTLSSDGIVVFPTNTGANGFPWTLSINDDLPLVINVEQGVGNQTLNWQGLI